MSRINQGRLLPGLRTVTTSSLLAVAFAIVLTSGCTNSSFKSIFKNDLISEPKAKSTTSVSLTIWHDDFEKAKQESLETGKPILADFTGSDWCGFCVKLKSEVFETEAFESWARDNVVLLELDYPRRKKQNPIIKKQNADLKDRYEISGFPTVLFLHHDGSVLGKLGYMNDPAKWISVAETQMRAVGGGDYSTTQ